MFVLVYMFFLDYGLFFFFNFYLGKIGEFHISRTKKPQAICIDCEKVI